MKERKTASYGMSIIIENNQNQHKTQYINFFFQMSTYIQVALPPLSTQMSVSLQGDTTAIWSHRLALGSTESKSEHSFNDILFFFYVITKSRDTSMFRGYKSKYFG